MGTKKIQDPEIVAIGQVIKILAPLEPKVRERVLWYVAQRERDENFKRERAENAKLEAQYEKTQQPHIGAAQAQAQSGHA